MRRELALLLLAALAVAAGEARGQGVGSWRSSPPNSKAIIYDGKGRRLYWDDNGQVIGRYDFRTRRYEPAGEPPPITSSGSASLAGNSTRTRSSGSPFSPARDNPPLAIIFRGPQRSYGRTYAPMGQRGPKVIVSGNFARGTIVRPQRPRPPIEQDFVQAP